MNHRHCEAVSKFCEPYIRSFICAKISPLLAAILPARKIHEKRSCEQELTNTQTKSKNTKYSETVS
jgi:hypothetical protein